MNVASPIITPYVCGDCIVYYIGSYFHCCYHRIIITVIDFSLLHICAFTKSGSNCQKRDHLFCHYSFESKFSKYTFDAFTAKRFFHACRMWRVPVSSRSDECPCLTFWLRQAPVRFYGVQFHQQHIVHVVWRTTCFHLHTTINFLIFRKQFFLFFDQA